MKETTMFRISKALLMSAFVLGTALTGPAFAEADDPSEPSSAPLNGSVIASQLEPGGIRQSDLAAAEYAMGRAGHARASAVTGKHKNAGRVSDERKQDFGW
jgi:hypothetical protein